jgi:two-component system response regulator DevR
MNDEPIRVMLVDDHEVVREGLRTLISRHKELVVAAEASTMAEAIEAAARAKPDVIVMDVRLPDGSGVEACREIREARPET